MAVFKCKMCGGALEIAGNESVAVCEYCGTKQTLPKLEDEKRANLYDRANHFRRNNEFDKAMGIYEQILNADTTDSEAYWSLVLCRYGIEYVEDPASRKRVPTVNRAQYTSILADEDYKAALQYADSYQKEVYEAEAVAIDKIQKGILEISQKEEPFDVFICYKETDNNGRRTPDSVLANDLYHQLTQEGFKVFFARITLEDKLGSAYEPYIFAALNSAKVMVVLGTKPEFFNAVWVKNEWSRYLGLIKNGAKKVLIPAYRDMDPYDLPEEFSHLQAQDMSKLGFMQDLIRGIKKLVVVEEPKVVEKQVIVTNAGDSTAGTAALIKRAFLFLEDGDWDSADDYCEKVLDIDPECAKAYVGKMLAELELHKEADLIEYKDASVITENTDYQKACRFADDKYRAVLEGYVTENIKKKELQKKEAVYKTAMDYITVAQTSKSKDYYEIYLRAAEQFEKIPGYKDADEKRAECLENREKGKNESIYQEATRLLATMDSKYELTKQRNIYLEAAILFEQISGYKDSDAKDKMCLEKADVLLEEAENLRKEELYKQALQDETKFTDGTAEVQIIHLKRAVGTYQKLPGYKDSDERKAQCEKKIEHLQAQILKKSQRRKEKVKKISLIAGIVVLVAILIGVIFYFCILPAIKYRSAMTMLREMQYEEAYAGFEEVSNYKDSKEKRAVIEAIYEIRKGNPGKAIRQTLKNGTTVRLEYDADGGVQEASSFVYTSLSEFGELQKVEKKGYQFAGWVCEDFKYDADKDEMAIALKASWKVADYTITYQLDGGVIVNNNPFFYTIYSEDITLENPIKKGFTFAGWTLNDSEEPVLEMTLPKGSYGNKVFTAHWVATPYTVTYNPNGGTLTETTEEVTYGEECILPIPEREHYKFMGWYDVETGLSILSDFWYLTEDMELIAKWSLVNYGIHYNLGGVKATNNNPHVVTCESISTQLQPAMANGYQFLGWYSDATYTKKVDRITSEIFKNEGVTLYAKWESLIYNIKYDLGEVNATNPNPTVVVIESGTYALQKPTATGYKFLGWYSDASYTERADVLFKKDLKNNQATLYAKWEPMVYTIEYYLEGGTTTETFVKEFTIKDLPLKLPCPEKENFLFLGWQNELVGTGLKDNTGLRDSITSCGNYSLHAIFADEGLVMLLSEDEQSWIVSGYNGNESTVLIPPEYIKQGKKLPVKEIASKAFYENENVKEVIISEGIQRIGAYAFYGSTISKVSIPNSVVSIDRYAFANCNKLEDVTLPGGVDKIASYAFYKCNKLKKVTLSAGLQTIEEYAFAYTSIQKIEIPKSVTNIGRYAFYECKELTEAVLPKDLSMGDGIFYGCSKMKKLTIPSGERALQNYIKDTELDELDTELDELVLSGGTFICGYFSSYSVDFKKVILPNGLKEIGYNAFWGDILESVVIPDGVETIGTEAFYYCGYLKEAYIPASVTSIGENAFTGCAEGFTIITTPGAYAETYALKKGYQIKYK